MKRVFISILIMVLITVQLSGCGTPKVEENVKQDKFYTEKDEIIIKDGAGRMVSFPKTAKTMATSWGGTVDSYMFALNITDRIVGTRSGNNIHKLCMPNLESVPSVGRYDLDKEALASVNPDVFIHSYAAEDILDEANKVGVRAIGLNLNTIVGINEGIQMIGKVFGVEERANYVSEYYDNVLNVVKERTKKLKEEEKLSVVVLGHSPSEVASSENSVIDEMIELAGGISCSKEYNKESGDSTNPNRANVGEEVILSWNPDIIFTQECVGDFTAKEVLALDNWKPLEALKNGKVYSIPCLVDAWYTSTPSACLGVLYVSMTLYPELYEDIDFETLAVDFYKDIYNITTNATEMGL